MKSSKNSSTVLCAIAILIASSVSSAAVPGRGNGSGPRIPDGNCNELNPSMERLEGTVERVSDGDTIAIVSRGKLYKIRYLSIDTPELHYLGKSQGYWAEKAGELNAQLAPIGSKVEIEFDQERCDQYGRVLGYVWKDGQSVNKKLLESGMAINYCIFPNAKYCVEYGQVAQTAIDNKEGMWGSDTPEIPYEYRRLESNRPHSKFVGDTDTKEVLQPDQQEEVDLTKRIFFMSRRDIKAPYHLSGEL